MGVITRGRSPRHWMHCRNVKKKIVLRTHLLQDLNVQQHSCEKSVQVGSQDIGQGGAASSRLF